MGAPRVVIVLISTDSSALPLPYDVMKFETAPPGQDATRIIPRAMLQDMDGPRASVEQYAKEESYQRQYYPLADKADEHASRAVEYAPEELGSQSQSHTVHNYGHENQQQPVTCPVEVDIQRIKLLKTLVHFSGL